VRAAQGHHPRGWYTVVDDNGEGKADYASDPPLDEQSTQDG
jgi:hypothetical protein